MPTAAEIAANKWLPDADMAVYAEEYGRTGFQGGLNGYRGAAESDEFLRQSLAYHAAWQEAGNESTLMPQPATHHFSAIHGFEAPDEHARAVDSGDGDLVQPERIGAVRRPCREDAGCGP